MKGRNSLEEQGGRAAAPGSRRRLRLLLLTHRSPHAPDRGDRIRSYHMLRVLARHHDVHVVSLAHDAAEAAAAQRLEGVAASVSVARVSRLRNLARAALALFGSKPLTHVLLDSPDMRAVLTRLVAAHDFDAVIGYCSGMARFALEPPLERYPFILDMVDVDSGKWMALAGRTRGPLHWIYRREARLLARFEAHAARCADFTTVVNARERDCLLRLAPASRVHVVANGIDVAAFRPPRPAAGEPRVVFAGVLNYRPNEEGALWMAREVWPLVRQKCPQARLVLAGACPTRAVRRLAAADSSIDVTGTVPSVQPYLWNAAVAVVPLATARGLQNKVLEAIAAGLPVVITPVVRDGLPPLVEPSCIVASDREAFAQAVVSLLARPAGERRRMAAAAPLATIEWPTQLSPLLELLDGVANTSEHELVNTT